MYYNKDEFLDGFCSLLVFCSTESYKKYFMIYVEGGTHAPFFWCCLR